MVLKHMLHFPARTHLEAEEIAEFSNKDVGGFAL